MQQALLGTQVHKVFKAFKGPLVRLGQLVLLGRQAKLVRKVFRVYKAYKDQ